MCFREIIKNLNLDLVAQILKSHYNALNARMKFFIMLNAEFSIECSSILGFNSIYMLKYMINLPARAILHG